MQADPIGLFYPQSSQLSDMLQYNTIANDFVSENNRVLWVFGCFFFLSFLFSFIILFFIVIYLFYLLFILFLLTFFWGCVCVLFLVGKKLMH